MGGDRPRGRAALGSGGLSLAARWLAYLGLAEEPVSFHVPDSPDGVRARLTAAGLTVRPAPGGVVVRRPFVRFGHAEVVLAFVLQDRADGVVRLAWWARFVALALPFALLLFVYGVGTALADGSAWRVVYYTFIGFTFLMDVRTARRDLAALRQDVGEAVTGTR